MDPVEQRVKPVEVELSRNLQSYLQRLGLLPRKSPALGLSATGEVALCPTSAHRINMNEAKPQTLKRFFLQPEENCKYDFLHVQHWSFSSSGLFCIC